jgi:cytoskeletal protein CcmA (bactofilin family)
MLKKYMQSEPFRSNIPRAPLPEAPKNELPSSAPLPLTQAEPTTPAVKEEGNQLIVGPNIKLQGAEITNCDILVVEGRVEAAMNSRQIRISESGVFVGKAEIDIAEVGGLFDGELTVREHLVIRSTGKVKGKIRYGTVTIEQGGVISGDVGLLTETTATRAASPASATPTGAPKSEPALPEITPESLGFARNSVGRR